MHPREKDCLKEQVGGWQGRQEAQTRWLRRVIRLWQNRAYQDYAFSANMEGPSLQGLGTQWPLLLPKGQMETHIIAMGHGSQSQPQALGWSPPGCGQSHLVLWGLPIGTHCWGLQPQHLVLRSCTLRVLCPDSELHILMYPRHMRVPPWGTQTQ